MSSDQLARASFWRWAVIRWHLFRCRDCQAYVEQIRAIGQAARGLYEGEGTKSGALRELEASILKKLEGGPDRDHPHHPPSDR